ncbi:MAG: hypothetical protein CM1200mP16_11090 [Nitrospina sp.]|nr:MAG: hypothetical protein CM1200mP16_11090 [Nitrospina sp.]
MNKSISMPSEELSVQLQRVRQTILKSGKKIYVEGLRGSASAYFISQLHQLEKGKTILVITSNQNRAELLMDDLKYFFHYLNLKTNALFFPSWEYYPMRIFHLLMRFLVKGWKL